MSIFAEIFTTSLTPMVFLYMAVGVLSGICIGALPGLTATMGVALLLPMTFGMEAAQGILMLLGIYCGAIYGGSISAILINTPGASGAIATTLDGFPLCQKGKAGYALGLSLGASTFGGIVASIIVLLIMKPVSAFALKFGTAELFLLALVGIGIIITISEKEPVKGGLVGSIGLLVAAMAAEPTYGRERLTFGFFELYDGVPSIATLCGFFAFSSMISLVGKRMISNVGDGGEAEVGVASILKGCRDAMRQPVNLIRSSLIGLGIGILPSAGVNAAALLAYSQAQTWSKHSEDFGNGASEGIVAPEAANNAVAAGALVPAFSLGIPGSATTAVLLAALSLQGVNPGPRVMQTHANQIYAVFLAVLFATVLMFLFGVGYTALAAKLASVNMAYMVPGVMAICMIGTFATRGLMFDSYLFLIFGVLGYIMKCNGYQYSPMTLGIIMGKMAESNFAISMNLSGGNFGIFFESVISWVIWAILLASMFYPMIKKHMAKKLA